MGTKKIQLSKQDQKDLKMLSKWCLDSKKLLQSISKIK